LNTEKPGNAGPMRRRAASIMVGAAEAESAAIVVAIALEERAVDIAFGTEDDSVPLPVVASLAAGENAGASHRDKVGCRIGEAPVGAKSHPG
jgi:hypothetical protein